jgi:peptidylprolyl isomerase
VTYFKRISSRPKGISSRPVVALATLGAAILIAGCGSSSSSSSIGVGEENTADQTLATATSSTPAATSPTTASVKTPTTGPLSKEPTVTPPTGPAPSKLVTKEIITGTGPEAKAGEQVTVNYVGVLYKGGKVFDASWKRNETFPFLLGKGQVIPGWDQGIVGMKVGGRRELIIPAELAYGAKGSPPTIPPNSALVFVVDLLAA